MVKGDTIVLVPVSVLCGGNITPTQYTFMWLLHTKNTAAIRSYVNANRGFPRHEVDDLISRGYLNYVDESTTNLTLMTNIVVTEKFTDFLYEGEESVIISEVDAFNEFLLCYPPFITIQGRLVAARTICIEVGELLYGRAIKGQRNEHKEILKDIEYGKEHELINMGLTKFLESRQWISIRQLRIHLAE